MDARAKKTPLMHSDERNVAMLCHLSTLVPIWALASNALIYFTYRESSRAVCFHARQGIHFHLLLLIVSVPMLLLLPFTKMLLLVGVPNSIAGELPSIAKTMLLSVYALYAFCCLLGLIQAFRGRVFVYPLVGLDPSIILNEDAFEEGLP